MICLLTTHLLFSFLLSFLHFSKRKSEIKRLYMLYWGRGGSPRQAYMSYMNSKSWLALHPQTENLAKVRSHAHLWSKEVWPTEWDYFPFNSFRGYPPTLLRTAHSVHEPPMGRCCLSMGLKGTLPSELVNVDGIVLKHQGKGFRNSKCLQWKPLYLTSQGWLKNLFLQADGSVDANFAVWNSIAYEHIWQYL